MLMRLFTLTTVMAVSEEDKQVIKSLVQNKDNGTKKFLKHVSYCRSKKLICKIYATGSFARQPVGGHP